MEADQTSWDSDLEPFLKTLDSGESQRALERLIVDRAGPLIRRIVRRKLRTPTQGTEYSARHQDVEDVSSQTVVRLIRTLNDLKDDPQGKAIQDFQKYAAAVTYRTCNEHLRHRHPERWKLRNRLRYLLARRSEFTLWDNGGEWLCGLAEGHSVEKNSPYARSLQELERNGAGVAGLSSDEVQRLDSATVVEAVLKWAGSPVELDDLVDLLAGWWGIKDQKWEFEPDDPTASDPLDLLPDSGADISVLLERRFYLERLWKEIQELPPRQRAALLLNLRDHRGEGVIELLPLTGVATIRQIARALEMTEEQFAELWNRLPLEDAAIGELLGLGRQQVINLRKSARERLVRRMRKAAGGG